MQPLKYRLARPEDFADISTEEETAELQSVDEDTGPKLPFGEGSKGVAGEMLNVFSLNSGGGVLDKAQGRKKIWGSMKNPCICCLVVDTSWTYKTQRWEYMLKKEKRVDDQDQVDWNIHAEIKIETSSQKMTPEGGAPHAVIGKLRKAGLLLRMCYSQKRDRIYIFITATQERIKAAAQIKEVLRMVSAREAVKLARLGDNPMPLANMTRLDFYNLKHEKFDTNRKTWEKLWDKPGNFVLNKKMDTPIPEDEPEAKYGGPKDRDERRDEKTAAHYTSFASMDDWKNVWIKYRDDIDIWEKSDDGSLFTLQDKLGLIHHIITSQHPTCAGLKIGQIKNDPGNPITEYFALHDDSLLDSLVPNKQVYFWFWTGTTTSQLGWETTLYNIWCYFGEEIAWYFCLLQYFAHWLIVPTIAGVLPWLWRSSSETAFPWGSSLQLIPMVYMCAVLAPGWDYKLETQTRAWGISAASKVYQETFHGIYDVEKHNGKIALVEDPAYDQAGAQFWDNVIITSFVTFVILTFIGIQSFKQYITPIVPLLGAAASGANTVMILIFGSIFTLLCDWAVVRENYRWRSDHENKIVEYSGPFLFMNNFIVPIMLCLVFPFLPIFTHYPKDELEKGEYVITEMSALLSTTIMTLLAMKLMTEFVLPRMTKNALQKKAKERPEASKDHIVWDTSRGQPKRDKEGEDRQALEIRDMPLLAYEDKRDKLIQEAWHLPEKFMVDEETGKPIVDDEPMMILQAAAERDMIRPPLPPTAKEVEQIIILLGYVSFFYLICPSAPVWAFTFCICTLFVNVVKHKASRRKIPRSVDKGIGEFNTYLVTFTTFGTITNWFIWCINTDRLYLLLEFFQPELNQLPVRIAIGIIVIFPILMIRDNIAKGTENSYKGQLEYQHNIKVLIENYFFSVKTSKKKKNE